MPLPPPGRTLRVIGFDDVPWRPGREERRLGMRPLRGNARSEGMVYGSVRRDGWGATLTVERLLLGSTFLPQIGGAFACGGSGRRA